MEDSEGVYLCIKVNIYCVCVEDKARNNRTQIRVGRERQEPGSETEAPADGADTSSNEIKREDGQIGSAATKVK